MIKHVSFALRLKDELTNAPLTTAAVTFLLDDFAFTPVRKPDGWFVFVNVEAGAHHLEIQSGWFLTKRMRITVPDWSLRGVEQCVVMQPLPTYPMFAGGGRMKGILLSGARGKKPVQAELVFAFGQEPIKLVQEVAASGAGELRLFLPRKSLRAEIPGLFFLEDGAQSELCTLLEETDGRFQLGEPLRFSHKRGAELRPARLVHTDVDGRFSVAYPEEEKPHVFAAVADAFQPLDLPAQTDGTMQFLLNGKG